MVLSIPLVYFLDKDEITLFPNEFVMLVSLANEKKTALARFFDYRKPLGHIVDHSSKKWKIKSRNKEQDFALNLLMDPKVNIVTLIGPAGTGKTMIARRLPGILPPLTLAESIDVTKVHSVAGLVPAGGTLVVERPFRAPHHTASDAGLVGGGPIPRPGEVSLAHHGVLFLDELPEYRRSVLEALRQPIEDGEVSHSRARSTLRYPARFVLAAAMNPCPCGFYGADGDRCTCDPSAVARYRGRISGPLLDRIDLHIEVPAVPIEKLRGVGSEEPSDTVRARVAAARERQRRHFCGAPEVGANSHMGSRDIRRWCALDDAPARILGQAMTRLALSARAHDRVLKVARTIADLEGATRLNVHHVGEAIQYRLLDRSFVP